jgi:molybdopterin-guanine dinucleotide biosynthesis adapter protein
VQLFYETEPPVEAWLDLLANLQPPPDLVIVEGWKLSNLPKIVLLGDEKFEHLSNIVAYVRKWEPFSIADLKERVYDREDIAGLVHEIKQHFFKL